MGDRANIVFFDTQVISPTVYLHWHGSDVPDWLRILKAMMANRTGDAAYAAARFVGLCHERIHGNLSLGIHSNRFRHVDLDHPPALEAMSPGNAGLVVVDTRDFTWRAYGGYLAQARHSTTKPTINSMKGTTHD